MIHFTFVKRNETKTPAFKSGHTAHDNDTITDTKKIIRLLNSCWLSHWYDIV